jgi:hypothetical protein
MPDTVSLPGSEIAHDLLRACHSRHLDREGIPMVLAIVDERQPTVESRNQQTRADGQVYADLLGAYAEALVPSEAFRPTDEGGLITAMQVLAFSHFDLRRQGYIELEQEGQR